MKPLLAFLAILLLPLAAAAQSVPPSAAHGASGNVIIVNGKKFFLLSGARHFNGNVNSPSALSVMHHPRPATRPRHAVPLAATGTQAPGDVPAAPSTPIPGGKPGGGASDVLSIFAPDEKTPPPTGVAIKQ